MRFALMTEPQMGGSYDDLLAAARWAEERGMAGFARSDHYYSGRTPPPDATDAFTTLAGLARDTTSIRLCVLVTPITFRHPAVIAKSAATIDQMSGGRFDLGVGTGWMELEHSTFGLPFPAMPDRFERLVDTLGYLDAAFGQGHGTFSGKHYRFEGDAGPKPTGIRMIIGGSGARRTPTLAGERAHEYNSFLDSPANVGPKVAVMRQAAERAGRNPDDITVSLMGQVFSAPDNASYQDLIRREADRRSISTSEFEQRTINAGVPIGTPDRLGESLAALAAIGVNQIYLQWLDLSDLSGLDPLWEAVQQSQ